VFLQPLERLAIFDADHIPRLVLSTPPAPTSTGSARRKFRLAVHPGSGSEKKNWPIENKQINNLYIYNVGNYTAAKFARTLLDEAKRAGITDAFITVYSLSKVL